MVFLDGHGSIWPKSPASPICQQNPLFIKIVRILAFLGWQESIFAIIGEIMAFMGDKNHLLVRLSKLWRSWLSGNLFTMLQQQNRVATM